MELRDFMEQIENLTKAARSDFDAAAHGACREHLTDLRVLLNEQPELEAGGAHKERS